MPCTHPAEQPGTRRDAPAARRRDALLQHRGSFGNLGQTQPGGQKGCCQQMAKLNSSSCSKRCPGTGSTTRGWGWQVGLLWDGCGTNLEHQKHWEEEGEEPKI